jgi:hypothetical protein
MKLLFQLEAPSDGDGAAWGKLPKLNSLAPRRLPMLKLMMMSWPKMLKLPWRLTKLRCEGVELSVFECKHFVKIFWPNFFCEYPS